MRFEIVSTEVDARLSFDREATVKKALQLIASYKEAEALDADGDGRVTPQELAAGLGAAYCLEKEIGE